MLLRSSAARALRSCTTAATTGVRVLLDSSVTRVLLLNTRVLVTAWPRCARVRRVLVALEQSSDRGLSCCYFSMLQAWKPTSNRIFSASGWPRRREKTLHPPRSIVLSLQCFSSDNMRHELQRGSLKIFLKE